MTDGLEQFGVPNSLIYTRRIASPNEALKLTGKSFGTSLGLLSASVAHELNTPLAVLHGSIEKLIETTKDAQTL